MDLPDTALELRSTLTDDGTVTMAIRSVDVKEPTDDQVVVRVEAAPINPSDLGMMLAGADPSAARAADGDHPGVAIDVSAAVLGAQTACRRADAGRQRGWRRGRRRRLVAGGAGDARQDGGVPLRQRLLAVPDAERQPVPRDARRHRSCRCRGRIRQPPHRPRHGRDHAGRRAQRAGAHGRRAEPRADAQPHLPRRRRRPRQHRAQARARRAAAWDGRRARRRLERRHLHR